MLTWNLTEMTAPQISSPTMNCSPSMARMRFSQHRDARPFFRRMIHLPPILFASSCRKNKRLVIVVHFPPHNTEHCIPAFSYFQCFTSLTSLFGGGHLMIHSPHILLGKLYTDIINIMCVFALCHMVLLICMLKITSPHDFFKSTYLTNLLLSQKTAKHFKFYLLSQVRFIMKYTKALYSDN